MGQPSNLTINLIDNSIGVSTPSKGIVFVLGTTLRGPVADPSTLITSQRQFLNLFGNDGGEFTIACLRMIQLGVVLRVNRITDGTDAIATSDPITDGLGTPHNLFGFVAKYPGVNYNSVSISVEPASNGDTLAFDLSITHSLDTYLNEYYTNLKIVGKPTIGTSHYLDIVSKRSNLVEPVYEDLSALAAADITPGQQTVTLGSDTLGADGDTPDVADYVGTLAGKTGFYAFDNYDDSYIIAAPGTSDDNINLIEDGVDYAAGRKDLIYFQHLDNGSLDASALVTARDSENSPYIFFTAGGLIVTHPTTGIVTEISELGDVIAAAVKVHNNIGEWRSFTGQTYGLLPNTLGVVNNFGTPAQLADLKILAGNQINVVVRKNGLTYLNDDYTGMIDPSALNFASITFMVMFITKSIRPTLEKFLGYPNTFSTWEKIYYTVKPFLDSMVTKEVWYSYEWQGDQFTTSLANLQINNAPDVEDGKYKARLSIRSIAPLKDFVLDFVLDSSAGLTVTPN
jgi:phage tail sheath protein FI